MKIGTRDLFSYLWLKVRILIIFDPVFTKNWSLADSANLWHIPLTSSESGGIGQHLEDSARESGGIGQIEIRDFSRLSSIITTSTNKTAKSANCKLADS